MADTFEFEIVTPEKLVVRDVAEEMQIPAKNGYIGVLPGHAPLITELAVGEITYRNAEKSAILAVAWGFGRATADISSTTLGRPKRASHDRGPRVAIYRAGSDRGSPNHGSTLLSKRVIAQIWSPATVST